MRIPRAELNFVAKAPAELPHPLDTLNILRDDAGHVAWFETSSTACAPPTGPGRTMPPAARSTAPTLCGRPAGRETARKSTGAGAPRRQPGRSENHGARKAGGGEDGRRSINLPPIGVLVVTQLEARVGERGFSRLHTPHR